MINIVDSIYKDKLTLKSLKSFLKYNKLAYSVGNKSDKINAINDAVESKEISQDVFEKWSSIDLFYEGNKHVYIFPHTGVDVNEIDIESIAFEDKEIHRVICEEDKLLLMLNEHKFRAKYDSETGIKVSAEQINYMTIIEIYKDIAVIYIDPPTYLYNTEQPNRIEEITENALTIKMVIDDYKGIIESVLNIEIDEAAVAEYTDVLNYLCKSVNDTISKELTPYTDKITEGTMAYFSHCIKALGIYEPESEEEDDCIKEERARRTQKLLNNFISCWEYYILENADIKFEFSNEYGKIIKEEFKTICGSSVKVATTNKNIYQEQLHYNIKGTVLDADRYGCRELKFSWRHPQNPVQEITTNLVAGRDSFRVIFMSDYDKEEIQYVLSTISEIKDGICGS